MSAVAEAEASSTPAPFEAGPAPASASRWRGILLAPARWLAILLVPDRAVPATVGDGRYAGPMFVATCAALLAAMTLAGRVDLTGRVDGDGEGPPAGAEVSAKDAPEPGMSDRERAEALAKARTVEQVMRGMGAAALPVELFGLALLLYVIGRYVGGKPTLRKAMALSSCAAMPGAARSVLEAVAASRHAVIKPEEIPSLVVPTLHLSSPLLSRLAVGVDPFMLWSVLLLGLGAPRLTGLGWRRTTVTLLVCFALWIVVTRLVLAGGGPPHPGAPS